MEKLAEANIGSFVHRRLSQIKILSRLIEHELEVAKGAKDVSLGRDLVENVLDTLEIFVEDFEEAHKGTPRETTWVCANADAKPSVTRLN
jgi:hypothetical protein